MRKPKAKAPSKKILRRTRRQLSIRHKVVGTAERPRICAIKTNKNIGLQLVDDSQSKVLAAMNSFGKNAVPGAKKSLEGAKVLGSAMAKKMQTLGIKAVVFDRNGFRYHGIIAKMAEGLRESGINV